MSTRATIMHGKNFHLYEDYDDMEIYLQVENVRFSADVLNGRNIVSVQLPKSVYLALGLPKEKEGYGTLLCLRPNKWQQKSENIRSNLEALQPNLEQHGSKKGVVKKEKRQKKS
ncbi:MAG: hypothetical protein M3430_01135 [Acidobacteriota bacterium]|nr:hypothetical protein [Acidobacteriota bacterium]